MIVLVIFEKLSRFWLASDWRQIYGADRTAHTVHCQKNFIRKFSYKGNNTGKLKMYKKANLNILFWGDNRFLHLFLLNYTQILVYCDIKTLLVKYVLNFFYTVHFYYML
jgi:hypothetical protein